MNRKFKQNINLPPRERVHQELREIIMEGNPYKMRKALYSQKKWLTKTFLSDCLDQYCKLTNMYTEPNLEEILELLMECGTDIAGTKKDHSPFFTALEDGNEEFLKTLTKISPLYSLVFEYIQNKRQSRYDLDSAYHRQIGRIGWLVWDDWIDIEEPGYVEFKASITKFLKTNIDDVRYVNEPTLTLFKLVCLK